MVASCKAGGYTLIEVLVAMSILAMTLTVIFRTFSAGLTNVRVSRDYAEAVLLAESRIAAASAETDLRSGQTNGVVDDRYAWLTTVERFSSPQLSPGDDRPVTAYRVTVDVHWANHGRSRTVSLDSVRLSSVTGDVH